MLSIVLCKDFNIRIRWKDTANFAPVLQSKSVFAIPYTLVLQCRLSNSREPKDWHISCSSSFGDKLMTYYL